MTSSIKLIVKTEMTEREGYPEEPFMLVHVIPSIDGEPRFTDYRNYPFEALAVYGQGLKQGEIWPFNCEWGYAACAGFNAPVAMRSVRSP